MEATYDVLYVMDSVIRIVFQTIAICAMCVWIVTMKGR